MALEIGDKLVMVGPRVARKMYPSTLNEGDEKLYRVLPGGVLVRQECKECSTLFTLRRADQIFCSRTCSGRNRQRRYRKAKKRANESG